MISRSLIGNLSKVLRCNQLKANSFFLHKISVNHLSTTQNKLSDILFSQKHEWVRVDNNTGTIGVSHYAQESLGDVVYVLAPEIGTELEQNEEAGTIESVKAASEIYSPVSGTVTEINEKLEQQPGLVNKSCYENGWIYKLDLKNKDELKELMNEDAYNEYLRTIKE